MWQVSTTIDSVVVVRFVVFAKLVFKFTDMSVYIQLYKRKPCVKKTCSVHSVVCVYTARIARVFFIDAVYCCF